MQQTYTELEWFVSPSGSQVLARCDDGTDRIVCTLPLFDREAAIRRAQLIASAPAMRDALEKLAALPAHAAGCRLCRIRLAAVCEVDKAARAAFIEALRQARQGQGVAL